MTERTYASGEAFKQAVEQRLRNLAGGNGLELTRRRQLLVFDRFLARAIAVLEDSVILKGGLVLEIRLGRARTTKDIDLRFTGQPGGILASLQTAARLDLRDFLTFEVVPDPDHPAIQNEGVPYDGQRFRAVCRLAGKPYGHPFGVDIGIGDPIVGEPQVLQADDILGFAGIEPPRIRVYPVETHVAEKLHAYTVPRSRPNSRVKDLPDIALLASAGPLDGMNLRLAINRTFSFRNTHAVPASFPEPDAAWQKPYEAMARADQLPWITLSAATSAAKAFLNPILANDPLVNWDPGRWEWIR